MSKEWKGTLGGNKKINEVRKQFEMQINIKKTKAMVVNKKQNPSKLNIVIDGRHIEQVTS